MACKQYLAYNINFQIRINFQLKFIKINLRNIFDEQKGKKSKLLENASRGVKQDCMRAFQYAINSIAKRYFYMHNFNRCWLMSKAK